MWRCIVFGALLGVIIGVIAGFADTNINTENLFLYMAIFNFASGIPMTIIITKHVISKNLVALAALVAEIDTNNRV